MKVDSSTVKAGQMDALKNRETENAKSGKGGKAGDASIADLKASSNVNMSERAQAMNKAREIASKETVDDAKVARLQKMIDEGKYNVDASAIADRMVDEHLLMGE